MKTRLELFSPIACNIAIIKSGVGGKTTYYLCGEAWGTTHGPSKTRLKVRGTVWGRPAVAAKKGGHRRGPTRAVTQWKRALETGDNRIRYKLRSSRSPLRAHPCVQDPERAPAPTSHPGTELHLCQGALGNSASGRNSSRRNGNPTKLGRRVHCSKMKEIKMRWARAQINRGKLPAGLIADVDLIPGSSRPSTAPHGRPCDSDPRTFRTSAQRLSSRASSPPRSPPASGSSRST